MVTPARTTNASVLATCIVIAALSLAGCPADVIVEPAGGGAGGDPPPTGGRGPVGAGGEGGVPHGGEGPGGGGEGGVGQGGVGQGGEGGAPPTVVPGCEVLQFVGDPVVLPTVFNAGQVRATALAGGRVGFVHYENDPMDTAGYLLLSNTLEAPFETWPPVINPRVQHVEYEFYTRFNPIEARRDGTFVITPRPRGIYAFDQPGVVATLPNEWFQAFPLPAPETGLVVATYDFDTMQSGLAYLATPTATNAEPIGLLDVGCRTVRASFDGASPVFSSAPDYYCIDDPLEAAFYRWMGDDLIELSRIDLPFRPRTQRLARRPGGYWYAITSWEAGLVVFALDENAEPVGEPWADHYAWGDTTATFHPWRDGFVASKRTQDGISVFVSDGYNLTASDPQSVEVSSSNEEIAMVVGGANDSSILFLYPGFGGISMFRADCVTPVE